ncbi:toll/interleukin-1 receptor domain-containing protein [Rhodohalobacter sulfatireducens]|uniref:Toll/interleukin-1 receptor domain-containing protein n=1 Tax=Rhodohalobacter sulfatireducens TaxID=2911366 RepID=A0ABS9KAD7_9BACT|nr:toll/interleukin-1 receptor domain-containing protein [Rhodohalobacter sulfatireducens]MCG2587795.1 toll/interleukin-1 receptor domain-containing protein [Rhodohalobacter sulfatireducens]
MSKIFMSYSHKDESLRDELETHLSLLKRQGLISTWHDRKILPGDEFGNEIDENLESSVIILLLVSPYFIASDYCYDIEMKRALERHRNNQARVIPIILEHCDWHSAPFGKLQALPKDGRPVTDYPNQHKAFTEIATGIRTAIEETQSKKPKSDSDQSNIPPKRTQTTETKDLQRSSNLRVKKSFSDKERDDFLKESFEYINKFFKNSLQELKNRNEFVDFTLNPMDSQTFTVKVYKQQTQASQCKIWRGSSFGRTEAIMYSNSISERNSFNEMFTVNDDGYQQFLVPTGMLNLHTGQDMDKNLSAKGAAELLWDKLIEPLQR